MSRIRKSKYSSKINGWYNTILPTSPDVTTYSDLPKDQDDWSCGQWQVYHMRNKQKFGGQTANATLLNDFGRVGSFSDLTWCKYDCDFLAYLKKEGMEYNSILSNTYCTVENITEVGERTSRTAKGLSNFLIPIALTGGLFYLFGDDIKKKLK